MKDFKKIREFRKTGTGSKRIGDPLFSKAISTAFDKFKELGGTDFRNNPQKTQKFIDFVNKEYKRIGGKHEELTQEEMINEITKRQEMTEDGHSDVISMKNKVGVAMKALQTMKTELDKLDDNGNLPTWWTNKVATAVSSLDGMADYLDVKVEETQLDEKNYKYEKGKVKISKQNFQKVNKDFKSIIKGKPYMMILDPKGQFSILAPVQFEELDKEDEPVVKKVIGMLKKASGAHAGQAKDLQKALDEEVELDEIIQENIRFKPEVKKAQSELIKQIEAYVFLPTFANESGVDKSFKNLKDVIKKLKGKTRTEEDEKIFEEILEETKQLIQETKDPFKYDHSIYARFKDTAERKPGFMRIDADKLLTENGSAPKEICDLFVNKINRVNKRDPESLEYVVQKGFKPAILIKGK